MEPPWSLVFNLHKVLLIHETKSPLPDYVIGARYQSVGNDCVLKLYVVKAMLCKAINYPTFMYTFVLLSIVHIKKGLNYY